MKDKELEIQEEHQKSLETATLLTNLKSTKTTETQDLLTKLNQTENDKRNAEHELKIS